MGVRITDWIVEEVAARNALCLKIVTDNGGVGRSEAPHNGRPGPLLAALDDLRSRELTTLDPRSPAAFVARAVRVEGRTPCPTLATAIALVEMACWDVKAKGLGVALHELWGGAIRDRIPICASGWEPAEPSADASFFAAKEVADLGYKIVSFDPFGKIDRDPTRSEIGRAIRFCEAVRAAVGPDVAVWIRFGGRFSPGEAIRLAAALERLEPAGIFDPISLDHRHTLAELSRRVTAPLALSRKIHHWTDARAAIVDGSIGLISPEIATCGGFSATRTLAALAETSGVGLALRTGESDLAIGGAIQLAATLPNLRFVEQVCRPGVEASTRVGLVDAAFPVPNRPDTED